MKVAAMAPTGDMLVIAYHVAIATRFHVFVAVQT